MAETEDDQYAKAITAIDVAGQILRRAGVDPELRNAHANAVATIAVARALVALIDELRARRG